MEPTKPTESDFSPAFDAYKEMLEELTSPSSSDAKNIRTMTAKEKAYSDANKYLKEDGLPSLEEILEVFYEAKPEYKL